MHRRHHQEMVLPYAVVQRVMLTCSHCGAEQTRLAAGVKKGMKLRCERCHKLFDVREVKPMIGTAKR
ncbi:hypothetical protein [Sandaracinus amylolyticus]|uniref:hypothetical protein n=1 Tax=Sandaracinus amylolyticus TaxID=927083 RepID=UPI001F2D0576|nr:hypothetical protein [Sandaracinus amylolyticus]UJR86591.1 Hypothetical protein I5071_86920 [Sandaracinus amylolyticus]